MRGSYAVTLVVLVGTVAAGGLVLDRGRVVNVGAVAGFYRGLFDAFPLLIVGFLAVTLIVVAREVGGAN